MMDQNGLKMHEKRQKIEFSNLKYLFFSGIILFTLVNKLMLSKLALAYLYLVLVDTLSRVLNPQVHYAFGNV